ncbi:MAG: alpha-hydroxy-acid oxidizing protein [Rhizobiales bacterium TMED168]|nr:MAG: alpha-hydroxy-acid oxidizing protein [Rhizobiales bacterium TMED168]
MLSKYYNIDDLRLLAKKRVPRAVFDYADGAAEDELTKDNNRNAFKKWKFIPDVLVDVAEVDTQTKVLGTEMPYPFALGPTAISYLFHHSGEPAVARAASERNFPSTLSSIASTNIEDYADASDCSVWYQMYVWKNREISNDFIKRCKEKNYKAIMLTVDVPVGGKRERDLRSGMTIPPRLTLSSIIDAAFHPSWWWNFIFGPKIKFANVKERFMGKNKNFSNMMTYMNQQFDPSVTWDEAKEIASMWGGPFAIKGLMNADDAEKAIEIGASAIVISNHGGRQLDSAVAPIDVLPEIAERVNGRAEILIDGGIRRGTDIVKAIALGADACLIGRPWVYGLAAKGEKGVGLVIDILSSEVTRTLQLLGCKSINDVSKRHVKLDKKLLNKIE